MLGRGTQQRLYGVVHSASGGNRRRQLSRPLVHCQVRKQAIAFLLDHRVALTRSGLQAGTIEHRDVAAIILNQTSLLQLAGGLGDTFATHTEHVGDQFLGHDQLVAG